MNERKGFAQGIFPQSFFREKKGLLLVLLTAAVSGASIFANSFAVKGINPSVFTFLKNAVVAVFLFSLLLAVRELPALKSLSRRQLGKLAAIGLIGGSAPFLLFFYALRFTTAINAGFLHKTLFIWTAIFATVLLKEKISRNYLLGAALLLAGNSLFFSLSSFGFPEALVLIATLLWAAENTIAKHALRHLRGTTVAFGRMFFGSTFILLFLLFTNQLPAAFSLTLPQMQWVLLTSGFLFAYVLSWYSGLRYLPVHKAAAVLLLAQPVTVFLSFAFLGESLGLSQAFGLLLIIAGVFIIAGFGYFLHASKSKGLSIAAERN